MRLRTVASLSANPFAFSFSFNSFGAMSSSNTSTPIFAKWHAIPEPMIPDPMTATFDILLILMILVFGG